MSYNSFANCVDCKALAKKYKKPKRQYRCDPCSGRVVEVAPPQGVVMGVQPPITQQYQTQTPFPTNYVPAVPPLNVQPVYVEPGLAQQGLVQPIRTEMNGKTSPTKVNPINGMGDMGSGNMIGLGEESFAQDQFSSVKVASFPYVEEKENSFTIPGTMFSISIGGAKLYHHEKAPKAFYWMVPKRNGSSTEFSITLSNGDETTSTDVTVYYTRIDKPVGVFRIDPRRVLTLSKYPNTTEPLVLLSPGDPDYEGIPEEKRGLLKIVVSYVDTPYSTKVPQPISAEGSVASGSPDMDKPVTKKKKKSKKTKKTKKSKEETDNTDDYSVPSFSAESAQSFEATREGVPRKDGTFTTFFRLKLVDSAPTSNMKSTGTPPEKLPPINPVNEFPPADF